MDKIVLDQYDLADMLSITSRQVIRLVRTRGLPFIRFSKSEIRFIERDVRAWVESLKEAEAEKPP